MSHPSADGSPEAVLQTAIAAAETAQEAARVKMETARTEYAMLTEGVRRLRRALACLEGTISTSPDAFRSAGGHPSGYARTDAVIKVLRESPGPLRVKVIADQVSVLRGDPDTSHNVSSTLSWLETKPRVFRTGLGMWALSDTPVDATARTAP